MASSFRDLLVWQKAKRLAIDTCIACKKFPKEETYGLASQVRRSAVSVPSNIAEGQGRLTRGEFVQFLGHARGSLLELQTQLDIAKELGYLSAEEFEKLDQQAYAVGGLINRLITSLQQKARAAGTS